MTYQDEIDKLEAERTELTEKCYANSLQRQQLQGEYDAMTNRRLEAQKEINRVLKAEIERQGK